MMFVVDGDMLADEKFLAADATKGMANMVNVAERAAPSRRVRVSVVILLWYLMGNSTGS